MPGPDIDEFNSEKERRIARILLGNSVPTLNDFEQALEKARNEEWARVYKEEVIPSIKCKKCLDNIEKAVDNSIRKK